MRQKAKYGIIDNSDVTAVIVSGLVKNRPIRLFDQQIVKKQHNITITLLRIVK